MQTERISETMLTVDELGKFLRIGRNKAYSLISKGQINYIKIGKQIRIPLSYLKEWVQKQCNI